MPNHSLFYQLVSLILVLLLGSCKKERPISQEEQLYQTYCASCHLPPKIDALPKHMWKNSVLPAMMELMDVEGMYQDPEWEPTGFRPQISLGDWAKLQRYILANAPEQLESIPMPKADTLMQFASQPFMVDSLNGGMVTYLEFKNEPNQVYFGDLEGRLGYFDFTTKKVTQMFQGASPVTWFNEKDSIQFINEVGIIHPSEQKKGILFRNTPSDTTTITNDLHRPVHTLMEDLNGDGKQELVVSEFGNKTGKLSLFKLNESGTYEKEMLLNLPGAIKTVAKDMDNDGKMDIVALMTQSRESITVFYQTADLVFEPRNILEFSPIYGTSWFELVDYNGDGLDDIITVHGDNADISYVHKPYHGMRIFLNKGGNVYEEAYFYPLYGATRVLSRDFDQDGDIDFAVISTFPDYSTFPERSFVYLENNNSADFDFTTNILEDPSLARWFLMDASDVDNDGDEDIVLSSLTFGFTPVPEILTERWNTNNVDLLLLENLLH